jgi:hypothetical protein
MDTQVIPQVIDFLRDKKLLAEDKETFKIIHDEAGEISLSDLLEEWAGIKGKMELNHTLD